MKKFISVLLALLFLFSFSVLAVAMPPSVVDNAELLTQAELYDLTRQLDALREEYDMDVAIVTENEMSSYSAQAAADDIYDYNGYGCGENDDGVLFYISMDEREYCFSTHAYGEEVFNYDALGVVEDAILGYLSDGEYYMAFTAYADICRELLDLAANDEYIEEPYDEYENGDAYEFDEGYTELPFRFVAVIGLAIAAAAVIALVLTGVQLGKMKTAVKPGNANTYINQGGVNITSSRDIYLYSHVSKTAKPKNNTSGTSGGANRSGGGRHVSSSGRSHGGRGGKF